MGGRDPISTGRCLPGRRRGLVVVFGIAVAVAVAGAFVSPALADVLELEKQVGRDVVHYKVVLPDGYGADERGPGETWPAVLVFGGGPQTMRTIDGALERNFQEEAETRGYIVIAPAAPDDDLFFRGGDRIFPTFLDLVLEDYSIEERRFHVAGPSNGGIAAMHIASRFPEYFVSATAFPGYLWQPSDAGLEALAGICVFLHIGEDDQYPWHEEMEREATFLTALGSKARYTLEEGQPHRIATLAGDGAGRLFDGFDEARQGCGR